MNVSIKGLQELQDKHIRMIAALRPDNDLGRAIQYATIDLHRYLTSIVHVDTGSYKAANRMEVKGDRGRIYVDPNVRNPRSKIRVADYAPVEEARGGSHAAYARTEQERGKEAADRAMQYVGQRLAVIWNG